jgi:hypothetical protein
MANVTYSFLSVLATIVGPNGAFSMGSSSGVAEEGITIAFDEEQDTMQKGADGTGMHSLHAWQGGQVTVRFLKTSPVNAQLQGMYDLDRASPADHGQNTIVVTWIDAGDVTTATQCGFAKFPTNSYAKDGALLEWVFNAIRINPLLGAGL